MTLTTRRAALLLLALTLLFFGPALWPAEGWALGTFDMRGLFYPWLEQVRLSWTQGQGLPWWDAARFNGYPFLSNPQVAILYPPTWLAILLPTRIGISLYLALHLWLGGVGVYLLARDWLADGAAGFPGLLAGATFMFGGFFSARLYAGHLGLIGVHIWTPWLLWAAWRATRNPTWTATVFAAVPLALAILAGHTTSLLYVGLIWALFALFLLATSGERRLRLLGQLAALGGLGLLLAAGQLLPLAEFTLRATRTAQSSYEFATDYSFPLTHLVTLIVPEFFGEPTRAGYWSVPNFEELTAYIGLLPWLGLVLALARPRRRTWLLVALGLIGLLLALGRYGFLYRLVYDWIPPFRLARAPGRAMFLVALSGSLLLAEGLGRWADAGATPRWWKWALILPAVGGSAALAATGALFAAQHPSDTSGRLWHQLGGWAWATLLLVAGGLLLARWLAAPQRRATWSVALLLLIVVDLWTFGYKLRQLSPMNPDDVWLEAQALLGEAYDGRVLPWGLSIFAQNGAGQVGINSLFGYNALELGAYTTLTNSVPDPRATSFDILGATHVVATSPLDQFTAGEQALALLGQAGSTWVYSRPRPLPRVRLVTAAEVIPAAEDAVARLHQPDFDPARAAIVDRPVDCTPGGPAGSATVSEATPGSWTITTSSPAPALLLVAENAYPGWQAAIDGVRTPWVTAYGALRAVCVPAGEHTVTWEFIPVSFRWGGGLALIGWLLVAAALVAQRRRSQPGAE